MIKLLKLQRAAILTLPLVALACGSGEGSHDALIVQGVPLPESSAKGLALTTSTPSDAASPQRTFYYDFSSGELREIALANSSNPALFFADGKVFAFNRTELQRDFQSFDPNRLELSAASPVALTDLTSGDPWDIAPLVSGKSLILASLAANKLQTLDYTAGELSSVSDGISFSASKLRPRALLRQGDTLAVLQTGISETGIVTADAQVYTAHITLEGQFNFDDTDTASNTIVDGLYLTATNPSGFFNNNASKAIVVGLCSASMSNCTAGADEIDLATKSVTPLATFGADFKYEFLNQIVDGPDARTVYAHVKTPEAKFQVVKLNVETKAVTPVHTFPDERLYGIAYDKSSRTLFVGSRNGVTGEIILYRDDQELERFDLDGVLYASTFVPR